MFKKLLSNLPFNPSLIGQLSFYAKRMHRESRVRAVGFIILALAVIVQLFAVISPPEPTLAISQNDIIPGGFTSVQQATQLCQNNTYDFATILKHFAISCDMIARAEVQSMRSTDSNGQLYSMGRLPYNFPNETEIKVEGLDGNFYMRPLHAWDSQGLPSTYRALSVGNAFNVHYYILFSCGNIVQNGKPTPPPPPPPTPVCPLDAHLKQNDARCAACPYDTVIVVGSPACKPCPQAQSRTDQSACVILSKTAQNDTQHLKDANNTTAHAGDTITYTLSATNRGKGMVKGFIIQDNMADVLEYATIVDAHNGVLNKTTGMISWPARDITANSTNSAQLVVKVKDPIPQTPQPCNIQAVSPCPKSGSYDLTMTNTYHNTITIKLPATVIKTTEQVTTTLPNTGPGTSLVIGFTITVVVGYFFARSHLMAKELDIARHDFSSTGDYS